MNGTQCSVVGHGRAWFVIWHSIEGRQGQVEELAAEPLAGDREPGHRAQDLPQGRDEARGRVQDPGGLPGRVRQGHAAHHRLHVPPGDAAHRGRQGPQRELGAAGARKWRNAFRVQAHKACKALLLCLTSSSSSKRAFDIVVRQAWSLSGDKGDASISAGGVDLTAFCQHLGGKRARPGRFPMASEKILHELGWCFGN